MEKNKIYLGNCLELMKQLEDYSIDIILTDPPYALGSEVIIRDDGKPDYSKATAFMNNVKKQIVEKLGYDFTYGYITKYNRIKVGLEKTHSNDAFIISQGTIQERCRPFIIKQTTRNNRCLQIKRRGYSLSIRKLKYPLQPKDKIIFQDKVFSVVGVHGYGRRIRFTDSNSNKINTHIKNVRLLTYGKGIIFI